MNPETPASSHPTPSASGWAKLAAYLDASDYRMLESGEYTVTTPLMSAAGLVKLAVDVDDEFNREGNPDAAWRIIVDHGDPQTRRFVDFVARVAVSYLGLKRFAMPLVMEDFVKDSEVKLQLRRDFAASCGHYYIREHPDTGDYEGLTILADELLKAIDAACNDVLREGSSPEQAAATLARLLMPYGWSVLYAIEVMMSVGMGSNAIADDCNKMYLVDDRVLLPEDFTYRSGWR